MWRHRIAPKTILHLGSWEAKTEAALYASVCPGQSIFVEALPRVFSKLKANIAKYPNHVALNACVGEEDGKKVTFREASNGQSSSMLEFGSHSAQHPDVVFVGETEMTMTRVDTLLAANGIEIVGPAFAVLDLQGCELPALRSMASLLPKFDWIFCEVNRGETYKGNALVEEVDAFLAEHGFTRADTYWFSSSASWGDAAYVRRAK